MSNVMICLNPESSEMLYDQTCRQLNIFLITQTNKKFKIKTRNTVCKYFQKGILEYTFSNNDTISLKGPYI